MKFYDTVIGLYRDLLAQPVRAGRNEKTGWDQPKRDKHIEERVSSLTK